MTKRVSKRVYYCCGTNPFDRLKDYKMYSKKTNKVYHFNYCEKCDTKYIYGIEEVEDEDK